MNPNYTDIKFLAKFVSRKEYANLLCSGGLFMHSAQYYHHFDKPGQGDKGEAGIFPGIAIYVNAEYPIYCMTAITTENIKNNNILISQKMIRDFKCENGFLVLIDFKLFLKRIKHLETNNIPYYHDLVTYGNPTFELSTKWLCNPSLDNLFVKNPYFSYQQEYRIVVLEPLKPRIERKLYNNKYINFAKYDKYKIYKIPNGLQDITQIYQINTLKTQNNYICIPL